MIGAVIADMAAWTWVHDRECFYNRLVSHDAKLSGYGLLTMSMWRTINEGGLIHKNRFYVEIGKALSHADSSCVDLPTDWRRWGQSEYDNPIPFDLKIALIISAFINSGFLTEERQKQMDWVYFFHGGKQEYYAQSIMAIIRRLHEGKTKDESVKDIPKPVIDYYKSGAEHNFCDLLEYVTFAWRCFYYSWDYTSALHNAAKCNGNRHLAIVLTGAFADAMYGNHYSMIKNKYGGNIEYIEFPRTLNESYLECLNTIRNEEDKDRIFFQKNNALSNVERQHWSPVENPYHVISITPDLERKIKYAFHTGWEQRYGVYLDNGWFYVYRSHFILLRFQIKNDERGIGRISYLQISDDPHARIEDLGCVLEVLERTR